MQPGNPVVRSGLRGAFLALLIGSPAAAQEPSVFGPGTVSKPGGSVFRGQFSPDGVEFWFFRKVRENAEDYRIFVSRRTVDGWAEPEQVTFGVDGTSDMYPAPAPDGRRLVFTSYRPFPGDTAGHDNANLWYVEREGGGWSAPRPLRGASSPARYESGPWFDRDGALHFASVSPDWRSTEHRVLPAGSDLATASWVHDPIIDPWQRWRPDRHVHHGMPSPDGRLMLLDVSEVIGGRRGPTDLWLVRREGHGWSEPVRLPASINTPDAFENFVVFTPDGSTMLFARGFTMYYEVPVAELPGSR